MVMTDEVIKCFNDAVAEVGIYNMVLVDRLRGALTRILMARQPSAEQLVGVSSINIERMLAECVPGGTSCDPQQVADAIRSYCNAWPGDAVQQGEAVESINWTSETHIALREAYEIEAERDYFAARPHLDDQPARERFDAGFKRGFDAAASLKDSTQAAAAPQPVAQGDPMDWPLPCDVTVGHGTMRKGVSLRTLVTRMKVLYEMATGENADRVAHLTLAKRQHRMAQLRAAMTPAPAYEALSQAAQDVLAERRRQIEVEGWTPEHDDRHNEQSMSIAAACYVLNGTMPTRVGPQRVSLEHLWRWTGWSVTWFKPKDRRTDLVRAGALILAELERLDRAHGAGDRGETEHG